MRRTSRAWLIGVVLMLTGCASTTIPSPSPAGTPSISPSLPSATLGPMPSAPATSSAPSTSPTPSASPEAFTISTPAFADGAAIPSRFTCDGAGGSPEIDWSGAPTESQTLTLTVIDPDAGDFVHWLVFDIQATPSGSLAADLGTSSATPPQGLNSRGDRGYTGPCPPSGRHHYVFTLYALDKTLGLTGSPSRAELEATIQGHVLATAKMTGTYQRS
jgi:Raf kinase inhibitor-like protein, YbhB/YbcL family